ncbi:MAG: SUMF1/EgtB/PvdO family nonheme iron enzyme [Calditrichaeota bacterium]|nr:SUMF1/EgtB/PvdO family nonheme iron enzyme [Candidatus Cloacimonadota bacterium]MCB1048167.1 SUMF1/EgtB/PvdO family nonheme iron enzyme [Calditrichota bacterium]MCB9472305.1 SUMF1/EgtB/PvdO family nonheme iron enzyme [Candidatus Delongbacteria bacterium]
MHGTSRISDPSSEINSVIGIHHGSYRLPTQAEWERAARYDVGRTLPWGEVEVSSERANHLGSGWSMPVGSYPGGRSELGIDDMAGNVWEWKGDQFWWLIFAR